MFKSRIIILCSILIFMVGFFVRVTFAQNASDLQQQINNRTNEIQQIEIEIKNYQNQINKIGAQALTLQSTLQIIETNQKQLQSKIQLTGKNIQKTTTTIKKNEGIIQQLSRGITSNTAAVAEIIRSMYATEKQSVIELLISNDSLSSTMGQITDNIKIQSQLKEKVNVMVDTKQELEQAQKNLAGEKKRLEGLKIELADQERILSIQKQEQSDLLRDTKNQESQFKSLIAERQARRDALDTEIRNFESQLQFIVDPKNLPKPGSGVFGWPLADIVITQQFGKTVAAKKLYVSGSHNGVDFRATLGTPVFAVADGMVEGVGDTDLTCPGASFGRWVFIRHHNGLATTYGHLSLIKAVEGTEVKKGQLIGYSGNTGYSTGPHLHISVYASNGVDGSEGARVMERPSVACPGRVYRMPIAPINAYLDPMLYFPRL